MANAVYPEALDSLLSGDIDVLVSTIKVRLLDNTYTYNAVHDFLDDITAGADVGTDQELTTKSVTAGGFYAADPATWTAVVAGDTVVAMVVYVDTGNAATSNLLAYIDTNSSSNPISIVTNGGDITVTWPTNKVFSI